MKKQAFQAKTIAASFLFFFVLGCQPSGGELLPLPNDGTTLTTSRFENDTAEIVQENIAVKLYGNWDGQG